MPDPLPPDDVEAVLARPLPSRPILESDSDLRWEDSPADLRAIMLDADYERAVQQHLSLPFDGFDLRRHLTGDLAAALVSIGEPLIVVVPPKLASFVRTCSAPMATVTYGDIEAGTSVEPVVTLPCPSAILALVHDRTTVEPAETAEQGVYGSDWNWGIARDDRERLPDGTIVNPDGTVIPPIDPDLLARVEAAKDERGVVHDPDLANEYFEAMVKQGDEMRRIAGWTEPIIEDGKVFPSAGDHAPVLDYREGEPEVEVISSTEDPPDDPDAINVVVY